MLGSIYLRRYNLPGLALVVDDDPQIRNLVCVILEDAGMKRYRLLDV
jgi:CheY-like chemotaxis protein